MKNNIRKLTALGLVLLMLAGILCACGKKQTDEEKPTGTTPATDTGENTSDDYDENGYLKDDLPDHYDFDEDYVIYTWQEMKNWEWVDAGSEINGTVMQKLVERQQHIEDRFGITIRMAYAAGNWTSRVEFVANMANSIQNNMHSYDLIGQYTPAAGLGAIQGLYYDLYDLPHLNLEKPWWPKSISDTCSVGTKLYMITGDITPTLVRNVHCMFVNTDLFNSLNLSTATGNGRSIYEVVEDGDWTLEMLKTLGLDRVGSMDGVPDEQKQYGISFLNAVSADAFYYGGGFQLVDNTDGVLSLSKDLTSVQLSDWFDEVKKLFSGSYADAGVYGSEVFRNGRALFYAGSIADSQAFSEENLKFTILPQPKRTSDQEAYYTVSSFWVTMYSVPSDADNAEMSGMVLEGLASDAYRNVKDEVYYNMFQMRYNAGFEGDGMLRAKMFDIVSQSVVFDTARFFADELEMFGVFRNAVNDASGASGSWSTVYGGYGTVWEQKIENIYGKLG